MHRVMTQLRTAAAFFPPPSFIQAEMAHRAHTKQLHSIAVSFQYVLRVFAGKLWENCEIYCLWACLFVIPMIEKECTPIETKLY